MSQDSPASLDDLLATAKLPAYGDFVDRRTRGRLLAIVGSRGRPGGALLTALGALRVGCGSVRVAAPASVAIAVGVAAPELTLIPLPEGPDGELAHGAIGVVEAQFESCDAIVIGPGLGADVSAAAFARRVLSSAPKPVVADARALRALGPRSGGTGPLPAPRIFTPREREMMALTAREPHELEANRAAAALEVARSRTAVVLWQGRESLLATPDGRLFADRADSRALGTAGSGDVLAGAIGGLLAQGLTPDAAAAWGLRLRARSGHLATAVIGQDGLLARDLLDYLPAAQREARGG